jgi:hypothetical protein
MPQMPVKLAVLFIATSLGGCLTLLREPTQPTLDRTFGSFVATLRWEGASNKHDLSAPRDVIGRIPKNLERDPDESQAATGREMVNHSLFFDGIADGRICFSDVALERSAYILASEELARYEVWIEALDDLDAVAARPLLPSPGAKLDSAEETSHETSKEFSKYSSYNVHTIHWRICGPAPTITPRTRYIAAVVHRADAIVDANDEPISATSLQRDGLLLWEIADGPAQ